MVRACELAGVPRRTYYDWRKADEQFDALCVAAEELSGDIIDAEIDRRGRLGVLEPIVYQGIVMGEVRKFSDQLLLARAKAHVRLRDAYRDRSSVEHSGSVQTGKDSDEVEKLLKDVEANLRESQPANDPQDKS